MTLKQWAEKQTGTVLLVPKGTVIGHQHWYRYPLDHPEHPGEWSTSLEAWKVKIGHEYRPILTDRDHHIQVQLDAGLLDDQALKAIQGRSGKSKDGALTLKRIRG